jgi:hypothetical protein
VPDIPYAPTLMELFGEGFATLSTIVDALGAALGTVVVVVEGTDVVVVEGTDVVEVDAGLPSLHDVVATAAV